MTSFTKTMLDRYRAEVEAATTHPFLKKAGQLDLAKATLSDYLTQDKYYAFTGYPKFISHLITHLDFAAPGARDTLTLLTYSLSNVVRETGFFDSLGPRFGLNLAHPVAPTADGGAVQSSKLKPTTKAYVDSLIATGASGHLDEGLVFLWAMEKLYNDSWIYASKQTPSPSPADASVASALTELIDNWTNAEFVDFVNNCQQQVDLLDLQEGSDAWARCEEVFKYVTYLEQRFWPTV